MNTTELYDNGSASISLGISGGERIGGHGESVGEAGQHSAKRKQRGSPKVIPAFLTDEQAAAVLVEVERSAEPRQLPPSDVMKRLEGDWSALVNLAQEGGDFEPKLAKIRRKNKPRADEILAKIAAARSAPTQPAKGGSVGFVGDPTPVSPIFEGEPRALNIDLLPVPPLDVELLPGPLRKWAKDIAERSSFPIDYVAVSFLVTLSSLVARKIAIRPKRNDTRWQEIANLWGLLVGAAGLAKSPSTIEPLSPLRRFESRARERYELDLKEAEINADIRKARKDARATALKKAATKNASDDEMRDILTSGMGEEETVPMLRRYLINDATIEKIGELLRDSPTCPLYFRDEIDGLFKTFEREGHEGDRKFYLECWGGNGSYTFDRISRGTVHVNALCLAFLGTIQPGPLARFLKGTLNGTESDGYINRFQLIVYPDVPKFVHVDRAPNAQAEADAENLFAWLERLNPSLLGAPFDERNGIHYLSFDDEAQQVFDDWYTRNQHQCRSGAESPIMASHLNKFPSLMASMSLLHHVFESCGESTLRPISARAARAAIAWCGFFEAHARRVYQASSEGDPTLAAALLERLKKTLPNPVTPREIAIKSWSGLGKVDDVRQVLGLLEDRNCVKMETVKAEAGSVGGRTSERYWVHPSLRGEEVAK